MLKNTWCRRQLERAMRRFMRALLRHRAEAAALQVESLHVAMGKAVCENTVLKEDRSSELCVISPRATSESTTVDIACRLVEENSRLTREILALRAQLRHCTAALDVDGHLEHSAGAHSLTYEVEGMRGQLPTTTDASTRPPRSASPRSIVTTPQSSSMQEQTDGRSSADAGMPCSPRAGDLQGDQWHVPAQRSLRESCGIRVPSSPWARAVFVTPGGVIPAGGILAPQLRTIPSTENACTKAGAPPEHQVCNTYSARFGRRTDDGYVKCSVGCQTTFDTVDSEDVVNGADALRSAELLLAHCSDHIAELERALSICEDELYTQEREVARLREALTIADTFFQSTERRLSDVMDGPDSLGTERDPAASSVRAAIAPHHGDAIPPNTKEGGREESIPAFAEGGCVECTLLRTQVHCVERRWRSSEEELLRTRQAHAHVRMDWAAKRDAVSGERDMLRKRIGALEKELDRMAEEARVRHLNHVRRVLEQASCK
eukprot:GEMP01032824.1.p1 GENE.GEMP01032824.1~~GEMP01032824.1.p1  ORF type:complete len:539 (+),score=160.03 GEMP01032824.1:147-1619(+)